MRNNAWYPRLARTAAHLCGRPRAFTVAASVVLAWILAGPLFGFSDTWQLVINTGTTIVTFLMVFLIQNTQNRDTEAIQVKLDELIRATKGAHNAMLDLEDLEEESLDAFRTRYQALARSARTELGEGVDDTGTPEACPGLSTARRRRPHSHRRPSHPAAARNAHAFVSMRWSIVLTS